MGATKLGGAFSMLKKMKLTISLNIVTIFKRNIRNLFLRLKKELQKHGLNAGRLDSNTRTQRTDSKLQKCTEQPRLIDCLPLQTRFVS